MRLGASVTVAKDRTAEGVEAATAGSVEDELASSGRAVQLRARFARMAVR